MSDLAKITTVRGLEREAARNPDLLEEMKKDPIETLRKVGGGVPNTPVYRLAVGFLGVALVLSILGAIALALYGKGDMPAILVSTASAAIGVIAGMLAPQPGEGD